jgi:hypothetical protein
VELGGQDVRTSIAPRARRSEKVTRLDAACGRPGYDASQCATCRAASPMPAGTLSAHCIISMGRSVVVAAPNQESSEPKRLKRRQVVLVAPLAFIIGTCAMSACGSNAIQGSGTPGPAAGANAPDVGGRNTPPALVGGTPAAGLSGSTGGSSTPQPTPTR